MKLLQIIISTIFLCTLQWQSKIFFVSAGGDYHFPSDSKNYLNLDGSELSACRYNPSRKSVFCEYYFETSDTPTRDGRQIGPKTICKHHNRLQLYQSRSNNKCSFNNNTKIKKIILTMKYKDNTWHWAQNVCIPKNLFSNKCVLYDGRKEACFIMTLTNNCEQEFCYTEGKTYKVEENCRYA